jgi:PAS domain S-box-containing protein
MPELKAFLAGGGAMADLIRDRDWSDTPLGDIRHWPQSLRSVLSICLRSSASTAVFWGPEFRFLYNDAWAPYLGDRHPAALGEPAQTVMADIWPALESQFRTVFDDAKAVNSVDTLLVRDRPGGHVDTYWSYSVIPVASEDGSIGGVMAQARETTDAVLRRQRDALMLRLADRLRTIEAPAELLSAGIAMVAEGIDADRIGYAEFDAAAGTIEILCCAIAEGVADISGRYPVPVFGGSINDDLATGAAIRIDEVAVDPRLADPDVRRRYDALGVASALVVPLAVGRELKAMLFAHHGRPRTWTAHEEALLRAATDRIWQEVSRTRAETALKASEQRYRLIFEQANDLIFTAGLDQTITECNAAAADALGIPREELIGRSIREFVSEEGFEQTTRMLHHKLDHGGTTRHDIAVHTPAGKRLYWEINSNLASGPDGKPIGLHAIARDVTERRQWEERQRLLINELNHRVKNTLALVQGLALQSFKDGRPMAEARTSFQERLAALAAAHDLLTRESWEGATLEELVVEATAHCDSGGDRVRVDGPAIRLRPKAAVSLAMALHELCTNATKYGALSVPEGSVDIGWSAADERLRISWRESGGPSVAPPGRRGFGFRMIERALSADLAGRAEIALDPDGLVCRIEAPLAEAIAEEGA